MKTTREYLFRGLAKHGLTWHEGYYVKDAYGKSFIESHNGKQVFGNEVIPETVGQYTGLTDKNGTKIFEGDIVLFITTEADVTFKKQVVYNSREACFDLERVPIVNVFSSGFCQPSSSRSFEVIGNIHQNKELIKK